MSYNSDFPPLGPDPDDWSLKDRSRLAKQLFSAGQFIRGLRFQMRFGELSRAPLRLLRLQILANAVECDWLARPADSWDKDLKPSVRQRHVLLQTLRDAINVRELLFESLPNVDTAHIRVYRESSDYAQEMIIKGYVQRNDNSSRNLHSLVMRAQVLGFCFDLQGGTLHKIST
jgi:hypothetical protein